MVTKELIEQVQESIRSNETMLVELEHDIAYPDDLRYTCPALLYLHLEMIHLLNEYKDRLIYIDLLNEFRRFCDKYRNELAEIYGKTSGPL